MVKKLVVVAGAMVVAGALSAFGAAFEIPGYTGTPAEWLAMPSEKQEAAAVTNAEQAKNFLDLFWARRDPTPGTPRNEFRDVYEARVEAADKYFTQKNVKGSMSDRGKVYILLGPASNLTQTAGGLDFKNGDGSAATGDAAGLSAATDGMARAQAGRDSWMYTGTDATRLGLHDFEVLFIQDSRGIYRRDPGRPMVAAALDAAAKSLVRNPELKTVPAWAKQPEPATQTVKVTRTIVDTPKVIPPPPAALQGAQSFLLTKSVSSIQPQNGKDPFTTLTNNAAFTSADDLGYAFRFCAETADPDALPPLKVKISIKGTSKGETINMNAPAEDALPEAIKAMPGCYLVRGSIPLSEVTAGSYTMTVEVQGAKAPYTFRQDFKVE